MNKCKNIECENHIPDNRIYCSLTCRNVYVNKHMRDYSKIGKTISQNSINVYEKNKKHCENPNCGKELPYDKRQNKYCDSSCAASYTNTIRECTWGDKIKEGIIKYHTDRGYSQIKICGFCNDEFLSKNKYCSIECSNNKKIEHLDEYSKYKLKTRFKFNLSDYPDEFEFSLIEKYGWYKAKNRGDNLNGVSRDHMLSVNEGFNMKIDPYLISHPANCKLMVHTDNVSKHKKSSITKEDLIERINSWDKKYSKSGL